MCVCFLHQRLMLSLCACKLKSIHLQTNSSAPATINGRELRAQKYRLNLYWNIIISFVKYKSHDMYPSVCIRSWIFSIRGHVETSRFFHLTRLSSLLRSNTNLICISSPFTCCDNYVSFQD